MNADSIEAPAAAPVLRLSGTSLVAALEQTPLMKLVASGHVNIVNLSAIAERLGRRWAARQDLIRDQAEKVFQRTMGPQAIFQRISSTDYLVAKPDVSPIIAQAECFNCLREILQFFLGEALERDIRVHHVTRVDAEGIYGRQLDVAEVEAAELCERRAAEVSASGSIDQWTPFVTSGGRQVRVSCALEPLILLRASSRIGYRLARRALWLPDDIALTPRELNQLARADIEKVDYATIARGLDRVESEGAREQALALVVPVSFITLSSMRGRATFVALLRLAKASVRHGLISEVCDIEGVPPSALLAATSLIRPFCLRIVGRVTDVSAPAMRNLKGAGLQGLALETPNIPDEAGFVAWTESLIAAAKPVTKTLFLYGIANMRMAALAAALGVTHATLGSRPASAALDRPPERGVLNV